MHHLRISLSTMIVSLISVTATAQTFIDSSLTRSCKESTIDCGSIVVTEPDRRPRPAIEQPEVKSRVMGVCGKFLPVGQDYQVQHTGTSCGGAPAVPRARLPMPVEQDRKDKAEQLLNSSMDDLKKRTKAQEVLKQEIAWTDTFNVPMSESWNYVQIQGDFNGPAENYQTTCEMTRRESYQVPVKVYKDECAQWETIQEPRENSTYSPSVPSYRDRGNGGSTYTPRREEPRNQPRQEPPRDKLNGTSSGEIRQRSRDNYERLRQQRGNNGARVEEMILKSRGIAQNRRCVRYEKVYVRTDYRTEWRNLPKITGPCTARRGTWRTYPVVLRGSQACDVQKVKVNVKFTHDPQWNPSHPKYLDLLPNKFDLLPGEKETITVGLGGSASSSITAGARVDNGWNEYAVRVSPHSMACELGEKNFQIEIDTLGRIKRKAPNPFALPEDQKAIIGIDDKGRPKSLKLIDQARGLRLDQSMNSRRFEGAPTTDAEVNNGETIGQSEAGGTEAFWVSTQFRMTLFKIDGLGRRFPVTLPNKFSTDRTDVFDNEMLISLGGRGGMDRLYRPSGPLQFIFGGLYQYLGVELSPETDYELEVKAAQREFPFYESTCTNGEVACGNENSKEELFSEAIVIKFKTEQTRRSWLKWLKDKQFVIF